VKMIKMLRRSPVKDGLGNFKSCTACELNRVTN